MACCLFVWLVVVGIIFFGTLGIWSIVNIGWVGYYYKSLDHANGVRDRARFQFCYCQTEDPARGVDDGHKFFQQKKNPIFLEKKIGVEYGKGNYNHIQTCGHMRVGGRVESSWGEGGRERQWGPTLCTPFDFSTFLSKSLPTLHFV